MRAIQLCEGRVTQPHEAPFEDGIPVQAIEAENALLSDVHHLLQRTSNLRLGGSTG